MAADTTVKVCAAGFLSVAPIVIFARFYPRIGAWGVFVVTTAMILASYPFTNPRTAGALIAWAFRLSMHLYFREQHARVPLSTCVLWAFLIVAPVVMDDDSEPSCNLGVGFFVATFGGLFQAIADAQKFGAMRASGRATEVPCRAGLWSWSRRANTFGELLFHVGIAIASCRTSAVWRWCGAVFSALTIFVLPGNVYKYARRLKMESMRGNLEVRRTIHRKKFNENRSIAQASKYMYEVSGFVPAPMCIYKKCSHVVKYVLSLGM